MACASRRRKCLDAVLKVFAGTVNHEFVASLVEAGARAVGLSGIDACLTEAEPMDEELGAVGRPVRSNPELLDTLVNAGFLPVVACVAGDRQGRIYNVNADQMAVACAVGFRADRLLLPHGRGRCPHAQGEVTPFSGLTKESAGSPKEWPRVECRPNSRLRTRRSRRVSWKSSLHRARPRTSLRASLAAKRWALDLG